MLYQRELAAGSASSRNMEVLQADAQHHHAEQTHAEEQRRRRAPDGGHDDDCADDGDCADDQRLGRSGLVDADGQDLHAELNAVHLLLEVVGAEHEAATRDEDSGVRRGRATALVAGLVRLRRLALAVVGLGAHGETSR